MSFKITDQNYRVYKRVFEILTDHLFPKELISRFPDAHPVKVLNEWEAKSKTLAKKGLKSGLNDILSNSNEIPFDIISVIDAELIAEKLPGFRILMGVIKGSIQEVLKLKKIKNIDQYYIIKDLLDDTTSEISILERESLSSYLGEYERATNR